MKNRNILFYLFSLFFKYSLEEKKMDYIPFLKNFDFDAMWMRCNEMVLNLNQTNYSNSYFHKLKCFYIQKQFKKQNFKLNNFRITKGKCEQKNITATLFISFF